MSLQSLMLTATNLEQDYFDEGDDVWENSPFFWIRDYKSGTVGAIGRRLAEHVFASANVPAIRSGRYLRVGQRLIAIKFCMEWTAGGFVFQQIKDYNYDFLFCLGVRPDNASGWLIPKFELIDNHNWLERDGLTPQHTGQTGHDTAWLTLSADSPPEWVTTYGGSIASCEQVIANAFSNT
jgi:hypothetical protein